MTVPGQPYYRLRMESQEKKIECKTDNHKEDNEVLN